MKNLAKIILPLTFLALPFTSSAQNPKPAYSKIGFATGISHNSALKSNFKTPLGYEISIGKEILPELAGEISINHVFSEEKYPSTLKYKVNLWSIGPNILWTPSFNGSKNLYFGAGAKYKSCHVSWQPPSPNMIEKSRESDSKNGIGFSLKFGSEFKLGEKAKLYLETEYDQTKIEEDGEKTDIGMTKFSIGIKF